MAGTSLGTAYVQIAPSADGIKGSITEALGGEAKNAGKSTGSKIVSFVKKALVTGAIGKVLKDTIQQGAEFEQLKGGVEKIFDNANISDIMADANNAYKDLNMSANQYLAAINQTGAAFAQTMGDQKGYDVARTGMKAIADYASGTGRDVDELSQKYALITRSTSSYQSIADQFSGILPATSKGFLEQAQAAGFLKDSYNSLTDVPIEEYQEAVTMMLEKGVTDMGLYGNTANETATTLSGSFAAMKAAASNFMTQLVAGEDLTGVLDGLLDSAIAFGGNLAKALGNVLINLPDALGHLGEMIMQKIQSIGDDPSVGNAAGEFIKNFVIGLVKNLPKLLGAALSLVGYLGNALGQAAISLVQSGAQAIAGWASGIWSGFTQNVSTVIENIKTSMSSKFDSIKTAIATKAAAAVTAVKVKFAAAKAAILKPFETARDKIKAIIDKIKGFFKFKVSAPHVPLPHFSISPSGWKLKDLLKGSIPKLGIKWYAEGGIADSPTVFGGMGEAGPEAILPLDPFWERLDRWGERLTASQNNGPITVILQVDGKEVARTTAPYMESELNRIQTRANRKLGYI